MPKSGRDVEDWVTATGAAMIIIAAFSVDWRAGVFLIGLLVWWDFR